MEVEKLNCEELVEFLSRRIGSDISDNSVIALQDNRVNGKTFLKLTDDNI